MIIGFEKQYELQSGYIANFWAIGQTVLTFDESLETDLTRPRIIHVMLLLYKDFSSFVNKMSTGISQQISIELTNEQINEAGLLEKISNGILNNTENTYFNYSTPYNYGS